LIFSGLDFFVQVFIKTYKKMKKVILRFLVAFSLVIAFESCVLFPSFYRVTKLAEKEAFVYIQQMHDSAILLKTSGITANVDNCPNKLKLPYHPYAIVYGDSDILIAKFLDIKGVLLLKNRSHGHSIFKVVVKTLRSKYTLSCKSESLAKNYIDAIEYFIDEERMFRRNGPPNF
jgi:hypothetical protein